MLTKLLSVVAHELGAKCSASRDSCASNRPASRYDGIVHAPAQDSIGQREGAKGEQKVTDDIPVPD